MIGITRTLTVGDREVTVRELTTAETRALLAEFESPAELTADLVTLHLQLEDERERLALRCLHRMTDFPVAELGDVPFSVVQQLCRLCLGVNAGFFRQIGTLLKLAAAPDPGSPEAA